MFSAAVHLLYILLHHAVQCWTGLLHVMYMQASALDIEAGGVPRAYGLQATVSTADCPCQSACTVQVSVESYPEWVQLVADFTIKSLNSWQWASASIFYLMGLWSRLVSSMPYLKGDAPSFMQTYVPKIARAYVTSR